MMKKGCTWDHEDAWVVPAAQRHSEPGHPEYHGEDHHCAHPFGSGADGVVLPLGRGVHIRVVLRKRVQLREIDRLSAVQSVWPGLAKWTKYIYLSIYLSTSFHLSIYLSTEDGEKLKSV